MLVDFLPLRFFRVGISGVHPGKESKAIFKGESTPQDAWGKNTLSGWVVD